MASFAAQVMDMFFVLVERVTGYGGHAEDDQKDASGAHEPTKLLTSSGVSETEQGEEEVVAVHNVQIRARGGGEPFVQGGSMPQVIESFTDDDAFDLQPVF